MNAQKKKSSPLPILIVVLLVVLASLGVGAFFLFSKPGTPQTPAKQEPKKEVPTPAPTPEQAQSKLLGIHSVIRGDSLWWISDKWYKDPILWPSIFEINKTQIKDPDLIFPGQKFDIPALIGTKESLAPEDYTILAQGYLEAYRVYQEKGKKDAQDYKVVGDTYQKKAK